MPQSDDALGQPAGTRQAGHPAPAHPALEPTRLAGLALANRFVLAPMTRVSATLDGLATDDMAGYYERFAEGGFALVVTEGTYTDTAYSQGYAGQPGIATRAQAAAWRPVAERVRAAGAHIAVQLMHAGALSQGNRFRDRTAAPSAIRPRGAQLANYGGSGPWPVPKELSRSEIAEAVDGFAASAVRAREAGFDAVEIHAANGYLIDQFLTAHTNRRSDGYGGGTERRARLLREVVAAVRAGTGDDFTVGVRLSQAKVNEPGHRWTGGSQEAGTILTAAAEAGADYLHIAGGGRDWFADAALDGESGLTLAALAGTRTGLPVIANGGLHDPVVARQVLHGRHAQLLAIGTAALANPDLPHRLATGAELAPFDAAVLQPLATLANARRWAAARVP